VARKIFHRDGSQLVARREFAIIAKKGGATVTLGGPPKSTMPFKNNFFVIFMNPNHSLIHETGQNYPSSPSIKCPKPSFVQETNKLELQSNFSITIVIHHKNN
jgi:hypothetical protein